MAAFNSKCGARKQIRITSINIYLLRYQTLPWYLEIPALFLLREYEEEAAFPKWKERKREKGGGVGYVSLGKLAEMSNSRAFASNQRPNKTTPSRGACAPPPLSSPLCVPLPSLEFFVTLRLLTPLPRAPQTSSFPQISLAFSTLTTIRRQRLRRLTSPRRTLRRMLENVSSLFLSRPSYLRARLHSCLRRPHLCQMEIARERLAGSHVDEIFAYSPGNSRIVCFDVHIYLTGIRTEPFRQLELFSGRWFTCRVETLRG